MPQTCALTQEYNYSSTTGTNDTGLMHTDTFLNISFYYKCIRHASDCIVCAVFMYTPHKFFPKLAGPPGQ